MSVVNSKLGLTSHSRKREKRADDPAPLLIGMSRVACFPTLVVLCPSRLRYALYARLCRPINVLRNALKSHTERETVLVRELLKKAKDKSR